MLIQFCVSNLHLVIVYGRIFLVDSRGYCIFAGLFGPNFIDNYMHFKKCLTQCKFVVEHLMTTIKDNVIESQC